MSQETSGPKRSERYPRWGVRYLWAYLFVLATIGYGFVLGGYGVRTFRRETRVVCVLLQQWISAHLIPLLKQIPTLIALPFLVLSLSRFTPKAVLQVRLGSLSIREERGN